MKAAIECSKCGNIMVRRDVFIRENKDYSTMPNSPTVQVSGTSSTTTTSRTYVPSTSGSYPPGAISSIPRREIINVRTYICPKCKIEDQIIEEDIS